MTESPHCFCAQLPRDGQFLVLDTPPEQLFKIVNDSKLSGWNGELDMMDMIRRVQKEAL